MPVPIPDAIALQTNRGVSAEEIKRLAIAAGFDLVGIADPVASAYAQEYRAWLAQGQHGGMKYLEDSVAARTNLSCAFPWVKSVISVAMTYYAREPACASASNGDLPDSSAAVPPADETRSPGRIARYAWGRDYHRVLMGHLRKLQDEVRRVAADDFICRAYVDTGPVHERELAARAGLGWIGKNTLLINPRYGSWFVLGELLTSLPLEFDSAQPDRCGSCTRCIDACPTKALSPYQLNATRCISYHTLENRGDIPDEFHKSMRAAQYILGCDICQTVCPWNHRPLVSENQDFQPQAPAPAVDVQVVRQWRPEDWDRLTRGKAHRRAKLEMWQRTAGILAKQ